MTRATDRTEALEAVAKACRALLHDIADESEFWHVQHSSANLSEALARLDAAKPAEDAQHPSEVYGRGQEVAARDIADFLAKWGHAQSEELVRRNFPCAKPEPAEDAPKKPRMGNVVPQSVVNDMLKGREAELAAALVKALTAEPAEYAPDYELRAEDDDLWLHATAGEKHALIPIRMRGFTGIVREALEETWLRIRGAR